MEGGLEAKGGDSATFRQAEEGTEPETEGLGSHVTHLCYQRCYYGYTVRGPFRKTPAINASVFPITWLDTFLTALMCPQSPALRTLGSNVEYQKEQGQERFLGFHSWFYHMTLQNLSSLIGQK